MITSINHFTQLKKFSNNEFELTEEELNNISVPDNYVFNNFFGKIILLNYDNTTNEYSNTNNKLSIKNPDIVNNNLNEQNKVNESDISNNNLKNFDYIPIKICFLGDSFSGRKTQAKLITEKYKILKAYSINDITLFYIDEYKRLMLPKEANIKNNKSSKKAGINTSKDLEDNEKIKYKYVFNLIESIPNFDKNKINDLTPDKISDEVKINLLIYKIKNDFPPEINDKIQENIEKKKIIEEEIKKYKENQQSKETVNN